MTAFLVDRHTIRVPTAWERLAADGVRVGLYDYLVTWPPQPLPGGFVIPGWLRRDFRVEPPDLFASAGLDPYRYDMDGVSTPDEFVANTQRELAEKPTRFLSLLERHPVDLAAVSFYSMDATSHRFWASAFPHQFEAGARADPRYRDVIADTLRGLDAIVGRIAAALGPQDTLLVVSDHGFHADERGVRRVWVAHLESWLESAGLAPEPDGVRRSGFGNIMVSLEAGPFAEREAALMQLYELIAGARSTGGDPLYDAWLLDVAPRPPGAERGLWERVRQWGLRAYLEWLGVELDHPVHGYVFARPRDETLAALWPEGEVVIGGERAPIQRRMHVEEFSGTHDPTAIFLAAGPAVRPRRERIDLSVLDVAPLLFHLCGRPVPDDLEGELPTQALSPAWLAAHPPRQVAAGALPRLPEPAAGPGASGAPAADDEALTERLRALGYVE